MHTISLFFFFALFLLSTTSTKKKHLELLNQETKLHFVWKVWKVQKSRLFGQFLPKFLWVIIKNIWSGNDTHTHKKNSDGHILSSKGRGGVINDYYCYNYYWQNQWQPLNLQTKRLDGCEGEKEQKHTTRRKRAWHRERGREREREREREGGERSVVLLLLSSLWSPQLL